MFHANNIVALNMFATLATGIFRNYPWHLGQHNLLTILDWAQSYDCHCDPSSMYNVHPHHNATRKWRASVSNLLRCIDPQSVELDPGWAVTRLTQSASSSAPATFICNGSPRRLQLSCTYWKHYSLCSSF